MGCKVTDNMFLNSWMPEKRTILRFYVLNNSPDAPWQINRCSPPAYTARKHGYMVNIHAAQEQEKSSWNQWPYPEFAKLCAAPISTPTLGSAKTRLLVEYVRLLLKGLIEQSWTSAHALVTKLICHWLSSTRHGVNNEMYRDEKA